MAEGGQRGVRNLQTRAEMGMGGMNGHENPRSLITEQEAKAAFHNTHQRLHPNKCCLSITYCSTLQGVKGSKATFPGTSPGGLICAPFHVCTQALSEEGRQGRNTAPQRSDNWRVCPPSLPRKVPSLLWVVLSFTVQRTHGISHL